MPIVVRTYYLQYILHIGCPENVHFFIPEGTKNACGARAATFALHRRYFWVLFDQKMARVRSPRRPNAAEGLQNTSQNTPKNDTCQDRVSLRVRKVPAPCQKYLKLYKNTGKRIQLTYVFLRWILKGSVCKTIQLCKKSVNRGGLGEAHVDIEITTISVKPEGRYSILH